MAKPRTCRNVSGASTNSSGTHISTPAISHTLISALFKALALTEISALAQTPVPAKIPTSTPGPSTIYINEILQTATKIALKFLA